MHRCRCRLNEQRLPDIRRVPQERQQNGEADPSRGIRDFQAQQAARQPFHENAV